jgi:hypothetical protein
LAQGEGCGEGEEMKSESCTMADIIIGLLIGFVAWVTAVWICAVVL